MDKCSALAGKLLLSLGASTAAHGVYLHTDVMGALSGVAAACWCPKHERAVCSRRHAAAAVVQGPASMLVLLVNHSSTLLMLQHLPAGFPF